MLLANQRFSLLYDSRELGQDHLKALLLRFELCFLDTTNISDSCFFSNWHDYFQYFVILFGFLNILIPIRVVLQAV